MSKYCPVMQRIKSNYEQRQCYYLTRRTPVIIRLDGKAFHSYCKPLKNRFDTAFMEVMNLTAIKLAESIQGTQVIYLQSDEISILLHDYKDLTSEAWFDYNKSKVETISAAIASVEFTINSNLIWNRGVYIHRELDTVIENPKFKSAYFDSRSFNLPEQEVNNYFVARQRDCIRNSINSLGQSLYSAKELHGKNLSQVQELIFVKSHNWNDLPTSWKRGRCVIKTNVIVNNVERSKWIIDNDIPEFTQDINYIEQYLKTNY
jgi:tRNA(His) 5'-end guanylyltransferase